MIRTLMAKRRQIELQRKKDKRAGFTLVELAIVIVIIGLIVGGILVGQDLIKAATIRATLTDLEKYNAGATTFRNKYGGLPGDILATNAAQFGLLAGPNVAGNGRDGADGRGDGDGLMEGCTTSATALGCETALFWVDLSQAGLIPQDISSYTPTGVTTVASAIDTIAAMQGYMPAQRVRQGAFQHVYAFQGRNRFLLGGHVADAGGAVRSSAGLTPGEARSMDEKLDDALPGAGVVVAMDVASPTAAATTLTTIDAGQAAPVDAWECISGTGTARVYNVLEASIDETNCTLQFRASF